MAVFALLPSLAAPAAAQDALLRPFEGLFGAGGPDPTGRQSLDFVASVYGGYDDNVSETLGAPVDPRLQVPSWLAGASAGLRYGRRLTPRATFGASLFTDGRYLFDIEEFSWNGTSAGAGVRLAVGKNGAFTASQSVGYRPYYRFGVLPPVLPQAPNDGIGIVQPPDADYFLAGIKSWAYDTAVTYNHQITRRMYGVASYNLRYNDYFDSDVPDFRDQYVGGRITYRITSFMSARGGYFYRYGEYLNPVGEDESYSDHLIDAGVDLGKAWQFAWALGPRTTFSAGFGTAFTTTFRNEDLRVNFNLTGNARFTHYFNDRWQFQSGYDRRVGFQDGITNPWIYDTAYASIGGYVNRRVSVSAATAYATGSQIDGPGTYDTWTNAARVQVALARSTAAFVQYYRYRYIYEDTVLPVGLPSDFDRQGVRFGLTFWVPLLR